MTVTRGARILTNRAPKRAPMPSPYLKRPQLPELSSPARTAAAVASSPITAAAGPAYEGTGGQGIPSFDLTGEQSEIDFMVENIGWVGFYVQVKAMLGAMCPWTVEQRVGSEWVTSDDPRMNALAARILPPTRSQAGMRFRSLRLQASIGEHAFWPVSTPDRGLCFDIAHPAQLRKGQAPDTFGVATRRDARPASGVGYNEFPIERLRRHWIPDDKWPDEAYTPLTAILTEMRIYRSLVLNMHRAADSRMLMNGLLWISTEDGEGAGDTWVAPDVDAFDAHDSTPATPDGGGLSELVREFSRFGARAFRDHRGDDVASRLPFPFPHHTRPEMIDLGRPIDTATLEGLGEVVFAAGRGLNIPTQFLVVGEASANHWNDAEMRRALHERAVFPELEANNDFWTEYALRPLLASPIGGQALADDNPNEWRLGYDSSPIDIKSDSAALAIQAWEKGIASRERTAQKLGIAESDLLELPSGIDGYEHWVTATASRTAPEAPQAVAEPTEPDTSISAGALALLGR